MTKKIYTGVNDTARQVKKAYIGVSDTARKIKKGYIGIGGIARPFWGSSSEELVYYGTITPLSVPRYYLTAATVGDYGLFAGGAGATGAAVDAYDTALTRTLPTGLSQARYFTAGASIGKYALIAGGYAAGLSAIVNAYDTALTCTQPTELSAARYSSATATLGDHAVFFGGSGSTAVDAYNASLTHTILTALSVGEHYPKAIAIGDFALIGLGGNGTGALNVYSAALTRLTPLSLSDNRREGAATATENHALFVGGYTDEMIDPSQEVLRTTASVVVDAFDTALTRTTPAPLSVPRARAATTRLENYAIIAGGTEYARDAGNEIFSHAVDAYDAALTRTTPYELNQGRHHHAALTIGNYALIAGGVSNMIHDTVDAYTII